MLVQGFRQTNPLFLTVYWLINLSNFGTDEVFSSLALLTIDVRSTSDDAIEEIEVSINTMRLIPILLTRINLVKFTGQKAYKTIIFHEVQDCILGFIK